eukprot:gene6092-7577_t
MEQDTFTAAPPPGFQIRPIAHYDRRHRTFPAKTLRDKVLALLENIAETLIVRFSIHGDTPVFDSRHFPWTQDVEADWPKVRAELDQIMQYRE